MEQPVSGKGYIDWNAAGGLGSEGDVSPPTPSAALSALSAQQPVREGPSLSQSHKISRLRPEDFPEESIEKNFLSASYRLLDKVQVEEPPPPQSPREAAQEAYALYLIQQRVNERISESGACDPIFPACESIEFKQKKILFLDDQIVIIGIDPRDVSEFVKELQKDENIKNLSDQQKLLIKSLDAKSAVLINHENEERAKTIGERVAQEFFKELGALESANPAGGAIEEASLAAKAAAGAASSSALPKPAEKRKWKEEDLTDMRAAANTAFRYLIRLEQSRAAAAEEGKKKTQPQGSDEKAAGPPPPSEKKLEPPNADKKVSSPGTQDKKEEELKEEDAASPEDINA